MDTHFRRPTLVLGLACLLAVLLFPLVMATPGAHLWARYLIPIAVVFLWGRRRDIYLVTALCSVLLVAGYWFGDSSGPDDLVVNHVLPLAVLWAAAWLLARYQRIQEKWAAQRQELLRTEQELEQQVAARTAALQASERKYRDLFDNSPDMVLSASADDHIIRDCNRTLARALGYTPEELIGRPTSLVLAPAFWTAVQASWSEYVAAGDFANYETQLQRKDGTVLDVLVAGHYDPATADSPTHSLTFRDITQYRGAAEALRRSQEQLAKIFRASPGGIAITRITDGRCVEANDAYLAMVGYTRAELIGHNLVELGIMSAASRAEVKAVFAQRGYIHGLDQQITNARGETVDILYSLEQIDFDGEPCYLGIVFDITERKRMEELSRQQHERLVAMIESSPDAIWSVDREYRLLVGNSVFARGVTAQIGRPLAPGECVVDDPFPPGARSLWQPLYDRAFGGESFTVQIPSHLGYGIVLECQMNPIYDAAGGTIAGAAARAVDITARIAAELRVHETLARLQLATDAAEIGVWNWNFADGSLEWDDRTCDLYAVPPDVRRAGLFYAAWRARVHPDDLAQADPAQGKPEQVPPRWSGAYRIVLPGGAIRHVQSTAVTQYDREGRPLRMIGVVRDITGQVHYHHLLQDANAELEQRVAQRTAALEAALAELQAANRLKDEFMAMISHELRTPLTGVLSLSELLAEQVAGPLNERQAKYVRGINESGERLLYVINNILSYTHLVSGNVQLQCEPCDLSYVVHVCAVSQRPKAETKQQVIEELVEPAGLSVETDAEALSEVLKRLLDNAIKFTPAGGRIGIEAQVGPGAETVQLVVWDTGPGLAGEQLQQLVKPFAQGDGSLARGYEGIGMGLAYVNQMVRLLDGTLAMAPNPGGGSRFTITLPAGKEAGHAHSLTKSRRISATIGIEISPL